MYYVLQQMSAGLCITYYRYELAYVLCTTAWTVSDVSLPMYYVLQMSAGLCTTAWTVSDVSWPMYYCVPLTHTYPMQVMAHESSVPPRSTMLVMAHECVDHQCPRGPPCL